jgi:predicted MFS family arabinose efflux permease
MLYILQILFFLQVDRAKSYGIHENKSKWFYFAIGIVSIPSALLAGKFGDMVKHRVRLTIICLFLHGINTLLSYLYKTYTTMFIYSIFSGMFFGAYNAVLCVAILDCVGAENIAQAFGFLIAFQGTFLSLGPPIAGNNNRSIVSAVGSKQAVSLIYTAGSYIF